MADEPLRWILHLDMDAFFASVEQLDNAALRGRPVIIGGAERGVVSTASYEARRFGVRSAMPMFEARRLCPQAVFLRGSMSRYVEKSREIMEILQGYSPLVQQASIDEAYMDVGGLERLFGPVEHLARQVRDEVFRLSGLTCSVGLAPVKFLAKIASDMNKPAGLTVLRHDQVSDFLTRLPVRRIPGVGPAMCRQLELLGVHMAADVTRFPPSFWQERFGKAGESLYLRGQGIDPRPVRPESDPKSESAENTFAVDLLDVNELSVWLLRQSERVGASVRRMGKKGRTVTLKLKYADFTQKSRSRSLEEPTDVTRVIYETALALLREKPLDRPLRLIGVGLSQFGEKPVQYRLFPEEGGAALERQRALDTVLDKARHKYGGGAVVRGKLFTGKKKEGE